MDIPKEYIKMCEKAKEIQKVWIPTYGDRVGIWAEDFPGYRFIANDHIIMPLDNAFLITLNNLKIKKEECLWLPRQDQLQEMVFDYLMRKFPSWDENDKIIGYNFDNSNLLCAFNNFTTFDTRRFNSMEQLWLAFVMKVRYNKIWDSENWVKL